LICFAAILFFSHIYLLRKYSSPIAMEATIPIVNPLVVHMEKPLLFHPGFSVCQSRPPTLIAFMIIAPQFAKKRKIFRQLVKNESDFRLLFAVGLSKDENVNKQIRDEFEMYNDLLVGNFTDSYYNMTTKIMMSFKWISEYCAKASFTHRLNDDVQFEPTKLVQFFGFGAMAKKGEHGKKSLICTSVNYDYRTAVVRDQSNKFYVSHEEWPDINYSLPLCRGDGYVLSMDMNKLLYEENKMYYVPTFSIWLEDVLIGMLSRRLNATIVLYPTNYLLTPATGHLNSLID